MKKNDKQKISFFLDLFLALFVILMIGCISYWSVKITFFHMDLFTYEKKVINLCRWSFVPFMALLFYKKYYRRKDFPLLCLLCSGLLISYIYSINRDISLYGRFFRYEGLLIILCYYFFYMISSQINNSKLKMGIIIVIIAVGIIEVGYAYLQANPSLDTLHNIFVYRNWIYATGFKGNSNFLSSFMILLFSLSMGIYLFFEKRYMMILGYFFTGIFFLGLLLAGAMSGFVTFIGILFFSLFLGLYLFHIKEKKQKFFLKIILLLPLLGGCICLIYQTTESRVLEDFASIFIEVKSGETEEMGSGRIKIWKETLPIIPKYLLTGSGVDTFLEAFEKPIVLEDKNLTVDKAHNEYLQILVTEGILSTIGYLGLILVTCLHFFKRILKKEITPLELSLLLAVLAYLIQAFFNIRVTRVAPYFFIIFGLLNSHLDNDKRDYENV